MKRWESRFLFQNADAPSGGGSAGGEAEGEGAQGHPPVQGAAPTTEPGATGGEPSAAKPKPPESVPYPVFQEKLQKRDEELRELRERLEQVTGDLDTLRPAEKDALEAWLESLPDGVGPNKAALEEDQNARGDEAYEMKLSAKALFPLLKGARDHLAPKDYGRMRAIVTGVMQAIDRMNFLTEQISETFIERDADGNITADRRPAGLKNLQQIEAHRKEEYQKSGGKKIIRYGDSFKALEARLKAENDEKAAREQKLRDEGARGAEKEITERRGAAGAPGSTAGAPHRAKPSGPRTFEQIEKDIQSGKDFAIR